MVRRTSPLHPNAAPGPGRHRRRVGSERECRRCGAASLDYVLVLGVVFLLGGLSLVLSSKIMVLAYDMICALVSWPFQ